MNPYVAEALAALQARGYSRTEAQTIIDTFLASNPNDEHRLMSALVQGVSAVTPAQLLTAAAGNADLASRAYVQQLQTVPSALMPIPFQSQGYAQTTTSLMPWILAAVALAAAVYFWQQG